HFLLDRSGHGLLDGHRGRAWIGCRHPDRRWCEEGVLLDAQTLKGEEPHDHRDDRDHDRDDRPSDEEICHGVLPFYWLAAGSAFALATGSAGFGLTIAPSRTFCRPSTTTRSPGLRPSSTTQRLPMRAPTLTVRMATL